MQFIMNIVLIGMAGAGKSVVGALLAEKLSYAFVDVDRKIESRYGGKLQDILDRLGDAAFLAAEEREILVLKDVKDTVISPGGSVVYSARAMEVLTSLGRVVYLHVPLATIAARIEPETRGIVGLKGKTFAELYEEREMLYRAAADSVFVPQSYPPHYVAECIGMHFGLIPRE